MELPQKAFDFLRSDAGALLCEDVACWAEWHAGPAYKIPKDDVEAQFRALFIAFPEFRSLFDYRALGTSLRGLLRDSLARATDLNIAVERIGPRFRIQHGHGTYVLAKEIGADFFVAHLVTVGANRGIPTIGNNVSIRTGAVVVGSITIGDDSIVTANAVVSRDMPPHHIAYPEQTRIVKRREK